MKFKSIIIIFSALSILLLVTCNDLDIRRLYKDHNEYLHSEHNSDYGKYVKVHLKNGDVLLLETPIGTTRDQKNLVGTGKYYNIYRNEIGSGKFSIVVDSIAIIESNTIPKHAITKFSAITIVAISNVALASYSYFNGDKANYGSCPTFYYNENDDLMYAEAEGFSSAIMPSLEYADIDALNNHKITDQNFSLTMKNEALETHCINELKILAYPRRENERIYQSLKDEFFVSDQIYPITKAVGNEGDITTVLDKNDRVERSSLADDKNMCSKEEIIIDFDNIKNSDDLGLLLNFRQSLMTTYLIYNTLAYMGDEVSDYMVNFEKNNQIINLLKNGIYKELGEIEIYLQNENNKWDFQGSFGEAGPIAFNKQILHFKNKVLKNNAKIKIVMNKGYWRLDYVALANLKQKVNPIEISPNECFYENKKNTEVFEYLNNGSNHLNTLPGDKYTFNFKLPQKNTDYELFLKSKGYYLEWIRQDWMKDKNIYKLNQLVLDPKTYLKNEIKNYKEYEKTMEAKFWNSKIKTKILSEK